MAFLDQAVNTYLAITQGRDQQKRQDRLDRQEQERLQQNAATLAWQKEKEQAQEGRLKEEHAATLEERKRAAKEREKASTEAELDKKRAKYQIIRQVYAKTPKGALASHQEALKRSGLTEDQMPFQDEAEMAALEGQSRMMQEPPLPVPPTPGEGVPMPPQGQTSGPLPYGPPQSAVQPKMAGQENIQPSMVTPIGPHRDYPVSPEEYALMPSPEYRQNRKDKELQQQQAQEKVTIAQQNADTAVKSLVARKEDIDFDNRLAQQRNDRITKQQGVENWIKRKKLTIEGDRLSLSKDYYTLAKGREARLNRQAEERNTRAEAGTQLKPLEAHEKSLTTRGDQLQKQIDALTLKNTAAKARVSQIMSMGTQAPASLTDNLIYGRAEAEATDRAIADLTQRKQSIDADLMPLRTQINQLRSIAIVQTDRSGKEKGAQKGMMKEPETGPLTRDSVKNMSTAEILRRLAGKARGR